MSTEALTALTAAIEAADRAGGRHGYILGVLAGVLTNDRITSLEQARQLATDTINQYAATQEKS